MAPPSERSYPVWNIGSIAISITGRRTRISRPASGSGACRGSSHQGTRSGSSPPMVRSRNTSDRDGIGCLPPTTGKKCDAESTPGRNSPPSHRRITVNTGGRHAPSCLVSMLAGNKLTMPEEKCRRVGGIPHQRKGGRVVVGNYHTYSEETPNSAAPVPPSSLPKSLREDRYQLAERDCQFLIPRSPRCPTPLA